MGPRIRKIMTVLALGFVSTQFVNCTEKSDESSLYGSACATAGTCSTDLAITSSGSYMTPKAETPIMECTHDHLQVGGACEIDGASDSYIEYSLKKEGVDQAWAPAAGSTQDTFILREARCENGRYYMVVPRPLSGIVDDDGSAATLNAACPTYQCLVEYELHARVFALKKGATQFELVATAPVLPLTIQLIMRNGATRYCPN